jgi:hypothetical protein
LEDSGKSGTSVSFGALAVFLGDRAKASGDIERGLSLRLLEQLLLLLLLLLILLVQPPLLLLLLQLLSLLLLLTLLVLLLLLLLLLLLQDCLRSLEPHTLPPSGELDLDTLLLKFSFLDPVLYS